MDCPCGSGQTLAQCCGPYIDGDAQPSTPEALMRSRYSAYALEDVAYIVDTHDPETRAGVDERAAHRWAEAATFQRLEVLETSGGGEGSDEGTVEFVAHFEAGGKHQRHHELATFRRHDGLWFLHDGKVIKARPLVRDQPKVGRNDPCPCGSGKKHKKCCMLVR